MPLCVAEVRLKKALYADMRGGFFCEFALLCSAPNWFVTNHCTIEHVPHFGWLKIWTSIFLNVFKKQNQTKTLQPELTRLLWNAECLCQIYFPETPRRKATTDFMQVLKQGRREDSRAASRQELFGLRLEKPAVETFGLQSPAILRPAARLGAL